MGEKTKKSDKGASTGGHRGAERFRRHRPGGGAKEGSAGQRGKGKRNVVEHVSTGKKGQKHWFEGGTKRPKRKAGTHRGGGQRRKGMKITGKTRRTAKSKKFLLSPFKAG